MKKIIMILATASMLIVSQCRGIEEKEVVKAFIAYAYIGDLAGVKEYATLVENPNRSLTMQELNFPNNSYDLNALSAAALNGHENIISYLLSQEANQTFKTPIMIDPLPTKNQDAPTVQVTPVECAILGKNYTCMNKLLDMGADVNYTTNTHVTPLMLAVLCNDETAVSSILQRKPNLSISNVDAKTALDIAQEQGNTNLIDLIEGQQHSSEESADKTFKGRVKTIATDNGEVLPLCNAINVNGGTSLGGIATNINTYANPNLSNNLVIALNNSISQPATSSDGTKGMYSINNSNFMHAYGISNCFLGTNAGNLTLTGTNCVGIGVGALGATTSGSANIGIGVFALAQITSGSYSTAIGTLALQSDSFGSNTAVGYNAMPYVYNSGNCAFGVSTLAGETSGQYNISIGNFAGYNQNGANSNIFIGDHAGYGNLGTSDNIAIGVNALSSINGESIQTVAIGTAALASNGDGNFCTCIGFQSSTNSIFGTYNTMLGYQTGLNYADGESYNILIGANVAGNPGENGATRIGATGTQSACYIAGISGSTVNSGSLVYVDSTGLLGTSGGSFSVNYTYVNATPYTVLPTDYYLGVDCSGGAIQINLPDAPATGIVYIIKDRTGSAATNNITVTTVSGSTAIDGATTVLMNVNYQSIQVIFNGTSYEIW